MRFKLTSVAVCLTLLLTSCSPPGFKGGGSGGGSNVAHNQFWQDGELFYTVVWRDDSEGPALLLVARVPVKSTSWGSVSTSGYYDGDNEGWKFELKDHAEKKSWGVYDVVPSSSKESLVLAEQPQDLTSGRIFLFDTTRAANNVVQIDAEIPDMRSDGEPNKIRDTFSTLAETNQKVKEFLSTNQ